MCLGRWGGGGRKGGRSACLEGGMLPTLALHQATPPIPLSSPPCQARARLGPFFYKSAPHTSLPHTHIEKIPPRALSLTWLAYRAA